MSRFYFKQYQVAEQPKTKEEKSRIEEVEDSIDLSDVHRTRQYTDGTMIVLLKDGHEVTKEIQVMSKNGVPSVKNERVWVQSEIRFTPEDAKRFKYLTQELTWGELENAKGTIPMIDPEPDQELKDLITESTPIEPETSTEMEVVPDFKNPEITETRDEAEQEATKDKEING